MFVDSETKLASIYACILPLHIDTSHQLLQSSLHLCHCSFYSKLVPLLQQVPKSPVHYSTRSRLLPAKLFSFSNPLGGSLHGDSTKSALQADSQDPANYHDLSTICTGTCSFASVAIIPGIIPMPRISKSAIFTERGVYSAPPLPPPDMI